MGDATFMLDPEAVLTASGPFSYRFIDRPWPHPTWSIREGRNRQIGTAKTRAGARAAVRRLYGASPAQLHTLTRSPAP